MGIPEFRGWDEEYMVMVYFGLFDTDGGFLYDNEHGGIPVLFNSKSPIMQFIGLLDKNGVKIFEGDVVKCIDGYNAVVSYNVEKAEFAPFGGSEGAEWGDGVEVIGNIYENHDLLPH